MLVTDLRDFSGALRWWRGCATCLVLCWAAWLLAPPLPVARLRHNLPARPINTIQTSPIAPDHIPVPPASITSVAANKPLLLGLEGEVGDDLTRSILATGAQRKAAAAFIQLLRQRQIAIDRLAPGDRFRLVLETDKFGSERLAYAELVRSGQPPLRMLAERNDRGAASAQQAIRGLSAYRFPVFGRITSAFGNRLHPILGGIRPHRGVDIGAPAGTPIIAAAGGQVVSAGWSGGYGNLVRIRHADGIVSSYGHMSAISVGLGATVVAGQMIGRVGWTGLATGAHVHFELSRNGVAVNPANSRLSAARLLDGSHSEDAERRYRRLRSWPTFPNRADALTHAMLSAAAS